MLLRRFSAAAAVCALLGATATFAAVSDAPSDAGIDFRKKITLTPQETLTQSKDYFKKMQETQRRIQQLETKAKKDKDMVKLNCVADKATQVKGHMIVADQSMTTISTTIAQGDDDARHHEFTRMTILYQKVVTLGTEAEQCIGE